MAQKPISDEASGIGSATPERLAKAGAVERTQTNIQRILEAPLDRLWKAGAISRGEYEAGERYRSDGYLSAIDPAAGTVDWTRTSNGYGARVPTVFGAQAVADARLRWRRIERTFPTHSAVGRLLYLGIVQEQPLAAIGRNVFGRNDPREAIVAAHAGLKTALAALADHYGEHI